MMNIEGFLDRNQSKELLRFSTAGSVDDGKSTLIGRLLYEANSLYEDQLAALRKDSTKFMREELDLSLVMDGLKAEREQAITIDVAYRYFSTPKRHFIIADTPGHEQYTRNMATGASTADLAVVLIDASKGVLIQSKRHAFIASLLGIQHMVVAVNKMDLAGYSEEVFRKIQDDFGTFAEKLQITDLVYIPVSALNGDNVVRMSEKMPWYDGSPLLRHLENVHVMGSRNLIDLRFPVQYVNRPNMNFRGYAGRIASGTIGKGDEVLVLPSQRRTKVRSIVTFDGELAKAFAPQSVTVTLEDDVDVNRGDMLVHPHNIPHVYREIDAILIWMDPSPMQIGKVYLVKHTTQLLKGSVTGLNFKINPETLGREKAAELRLNEIGRVTVQLFKQIFCDEYSRNRETGSFIVIDPMTYATVAAGTIIERGRLSSAAKLAETGKAKNKIIHRQEGAVTPADRAKLLRQRPATLWFTGLSSSGKSSLAFELEKRLMAAGHLCFVLDGDNVRHGLNRDLSFSPPDRTENIRRVAEVARLFNEAGVIVLTAFISPYRADRGHAQEIIGAGQFIEIYTDSPVSVCERRDPKGLYEKAKAGLIPEFTGINAPYEVPQNPAIHLKTGEESLDVSAEKVYNYLRRNGFLTV